MKLAIRVDSSYLIGSGHLMRCLTLAEHLRDNGWEVGFVCRELQGNLTELLRERRFRVSLLPPPLGTKEPSFASGTQYEGWLGVPLERDAEQTARAIESLGTKCDWLLVDHYALDSRWESVLALSVSSIFVIDDLANRPHSCRVLLDHNLSSQGEARYFNLVPAHCRLLCGPAYALLRPEFEQAASCLRERDGSVRRILVFFGGVDATGETFKVCEAIVSGGYSRIEVDVVVGMANTRRDEIKRVCERHPLLRFHGQVSNMAELMAAADLAIGAGGTTSWERAFLGLPTIIVPVAENQIPGSEALAQSGAAWNLGACSTVTKDDIRVAIQRAMENPSVLREMGQTARRLFGNHPIPGVRLVADAMREVIDAES